MDRISTHLILAFILVCTLTATAGAEARKSSVRRAFLRKLGIVYTPAGCQVDHWVSLSCGGTDTVDNLRLICGDYMVKKEKAERNCLTLPAWKEAHPCSKNFCINPK